MANGSLMSCKDNSHDSTTCDGSNCIRLFGVQIDVNAGDNNDKGKKKVEEKKVDGESLFMRKCKSLGNLAVFNTECPPVEDGYLSDGPLHQYSRSKQAQERKRGRPWSEDEHRAFLVGLEKLGKGDWKGIAKQYVPSRNSSQVASHAQKYFIRLSATEKKRRRSSVFDIPLKEKNEQGSLDSTTNKAVETSQPTEVHHPVTPADKPPRSPVHKQRGITNFRRVQPYMGGVSCMNPGFIDQKTTPTVSWLPVVSYPNQNHVFLPTVGRTFATCAPFVPQASGSIQIHQAKSPQAPSTGVTKSNVLLNLLSMEKLEM